MDASHLGNDGPYVIEHGDVWFVERNSTPGGQKLGLNRRHVCGPSERLAVAYDAEEGILHKHGVAERVEQWAQTTRKAFAEGGFSALGDALAVISFPVLPETVEELNACIACSGRVAHLPERLGDIAVAHQARGQASTL